MDRPVGRVGTCVALIGLFACLLSYSPYPAYSPYSPTLLAQQPERARTEALSRLVNDRIRVLQDEAERLAGQTRTLLGDLRKLELERDLQIERAKQADANVAAVQTNSDDFVDGQ